jgi:hypothetical protein
MDSAHSGQCLRTKLQHLGFSAAVSLLLLLPATANTAPATRAYPVHTENPQQLLQTVQQLYGKQLTAGLSDGQLVVRAEPWIHKDLARLLGQLEGGAKALHITLSALPVNPQELQYTTAGDSFTSLSVVEGNPLVLSTTRTRERPSSNGVFWTAVEDVADYARSVSIVPRMTARSVDLQVTFSYLVNSVRTETTATLRGKPGQWIAVVNESGSVEKGKPGELYSTRGLNGENLFIKVEAAP